MRADCTRLVSAIARQAKTKQEHVAASRFLTRGASKSFQRRRSLHFKSLVFLLLCVLGEFVICGRDHPIMTILHERDYTTRLKSHTIRIASEQCGSRMRGSNFRPGSRPLLESRLQNSKFRIQHPESIMQNQERACGRKCKATRASRPGRTSGISTASTASGAARLLSTVRVLAARSVA